MRAGRGFFMPLNCASRLFPEAQYTRVGAGFYYTVSAFRFYVFTNRTLRMRGKFLIGYPEHPVFP